MINNLQAGLLGEDESYIRNQGLLGLAQGLLSASGYSARPISLGEALGSGIGGLQTARDSASNMLFKNKQLKAQMAGAASPYFQFLPTANGYVVGNTRTGGLTPAALGGGQQIMPPGGSPGQPPRGPMLPPPAGNPVIPFIADPAAQAAVAGAKERATQEAQADFARRKAIEEGKGKADTAAAIELAKGEGEMRADRAKMQPKAFAALNTAEQQSKNVINAIDRAIPNVNMWSAGFMGQRLENLGSTPAKDLQSQLKTIKANMGFDKLQEMKQNSPTGGALGQVAVQELEYLQSVYASLEQSQSPEQLRENLLIARENITKSNERVRKAYDETYGTNKPAGDISGLLKQYGQ